MFELFDCNFGNEKIFLLLLYLYVFFYHVFFILSGCEMVGKVCGGKKKSITICLLI
jgi:hypothetical protein